MPELLARLARREHEADRLGQHTAGDEGERERRAAVEPLGVVDDAQQRALLGDLRQRGSAPRDRRGSGRARPRRSSRTRSGARRAAGRAAAPAGRASGRSSWCRLAKASSISDSTPTARATVRSGAAPIRWSSSAVLPIPASPCRTSDRLTPRRTSATSASSCAHSPARPRSVPGGPFACKDTNTSLPGSATGGQCPGARVEARVHTGATRSRREQARRHTERRRREALERSSP